MKNRPDYIVYNEETSDYDANLKPYPTTIGSPNFKPLIIDDTNCVNATHYFKSKLEEIKIEYETLVKEYKWNNRVYEADYSFEPIVGEVYFLYEREEGKDFLSIISRLEWDQPYVGAFKLLNNGKWEKINDY